jgi:hypothetical protein
MSHAKSITKANNKKASNEFHKEKVGARDKKAAKLKQALEKPSLLDKQRLESQTQNYEEHYPVAVGQLVSLNVV